jgi:hypothetical protein
MAGKVRNFLQPALLMPPSIGVDEIARHLGLLTARPWHA